MELFTFIPYFLLLEREESDRNTLANANTEFIREVYELQRVEKDEIGRASCRERVSSPV